MGEIDVFCQNSNFDMFQRGDSVFAGAQETLQAEVDSHPLATDGIVLTFNDQTALIDRILEYGGVLTGMYVCISVSLKRLIYICTFLPNLCTNKSEGMYHTKGNF